MRYWWFLAAAACVLAQTKPGPVPPPELDEALRARVKTFFDAHVSGRFRVADTVVAEDSKDSFFEADKPRYLSYSIKDVIYSDDFVRAQVVVDCETEVTMPTGARMKVKVPRTTQWKFTDTQWFWYTDPNRGKQTPFGTMNAPAASQSSPGASSNPTGAALPPGDQQKATEAELEQGLSIDKFELHLKTDAESSDAITIENRLAGWVRVQGSVPKTAGLSVKVDKDIAPRTKGRVIFTYTPGAEPPPRALGGFLTLLPMEQTHGFKIIFDGPLPPKAETPKAAEVVPPKPAEAKPTVSAPAASQQQGGKKKGKAKK